MPTTFKADSGSVEQLEGVDRHFYAKQVGPASPFDDTYAFRLAAARAKDTARHKLIKRIREEERKARGDRSVGAELGDIFSGREKLVAQRTVDGVKGAPDDAIKL